MATNSLPNTICPPPLYYHCLQRDEKARGCEEKLDFCHGNQRSTVYDARATALHWEAIVGCPPDIAPQITDEVTGHEIEGGSIAKGDKHKQLPLLMALAREILSLEAGAGDRECPHDVGERQELEIEATPAGSKKAASRSRSKHNEEKEAHSQVSSREFVRECCVTNQSDSSIVPAPVRPRKATTFMAGNKKNMLPKRNLGSVDTSVREHNVTSPFHSPSCNAGYKGRGINNTSRDRYTSHHHTPTQDSKSRLVVHMPKVSPRRGGGNLGKTCMIDKSYSSGDNLQRKDVHLAYDTPEDASAKPLAVKTLMNELDDNIAPAVSLTDKMSPEETPVMAAKMDTVLSHLQTLHMPTPGGDSIGNSYVDVASRTSAVPDAALLQRRKESTGNDVTFPNKAEFTTDVDAETNIDDTMAECTVEAGKELVVHDAEDISESVQTEWDDYSDDFISESD